MDRRVKRRLPDQGARSGCRFPDAGRNRRVSRLQPRKIYILDRFNDKVIKLAKVGTVAEEGRKFSSPRKGQDPDHIHGKKGQRNPLGDDAAIFHTHLMILEDRSFLAKGRRSGRAGDGR